VINERAVHLGYLQDLALLWRPLLVVTSDVTHIMAIRRLRGCVTPYKETAMNQLFKVTRDAVPAANGALTRSQTNRMTRRTNPMSRLAAAAGMAAIIAVGVTTPSLAFESNGIGPFYYQSEQGSVWDYYLGYTSKTYDPGYATTRTVQRHAHRRTVHALKRPAFHGRVAAAR
jgi:hypothetical protein